MKTFGTIIFFICTFVIGFIPAVIGMIVNALASGYKLGRTDIPDAVDEYIKKDLKRMQNEKYTN